MDLNHRGTIISRASLPLDESSIWCLRRDSNPYEFLYPADFKSAAYADSATLPSVSTIISEKAARASRRRSI